MLLLVLIPNHQRAIRVGFGPSGDSYDGCDFREDVLELPLPGKKSEKKVPTKPRTERCHA